MMDESGLSARQAADQFGHAKVSLTRDRYFGRRVARTGAAAWLEACGDGTTVASESEGRSTRPPVIEALNRSGAPPTGLEPVTARLTVGCSAIELRRIVGGIDSSAPAHPHPGDPAHHGAGCGRVRGPAGAAGVVQAKVEETVHGAAPADPGFPMAWADRRRQRCVKRGPGGSAHRECWKLLAFTDLRCSTLLESIDSAGPGASSCEHILH